MSYIALYRKWRPLKFGDVIEQSGVVNILKNSVRQGRIGHAYLFCGTRGTGKTTIAKIFSRAINCLCPDDGDPCNKCEICEGILNQSLLDVMEIDAASNNGVDNIRGIIEEIAYVPVRAKYKVYIIDEVHMLSTGAFNALLKTLEEPPEHAVFLLATTDPQKLPATILSRCQRFEFKRISSDSIVRRLEAICKDENVTAGPDALYYIAGASDGAMRDAISILDQCISLLKDTNKFTLENVLNILGIADERFFTQTAASIIEKDVEKLLLTIDQMLKEGKEITEFISGLIVFFRNMLVLKVSGEASILTGVSSENKNNLKELTDKASQSQIIEYIKELSVLERDVKWASQKKIILEVGLIKLCMKEYETTPQVAESPRLSSNPTAGHTAAFASIPPVKTSSGHSPAASSSAPVAAPTSVTAPPSKDKERPSNPMLKLRPVEEDSLRDIFHELKDGKHMMIISYLKNVRALYYTDTIIYLVFCGTGKETKKESIAKPENMEIISDIFQKILNKDCSVKLFIDDELSEETEKKETDSEIIERISKLTEFGIDVEIK